MTSRNIASAPVIADRVDSPPAPETPVLHRPGKGEVLLAGLAALAMYTGLLLRRPYRSPSLNSLLAGGVLAAFYFYLRLRLGIRMPGKFLLCLFTIYATPALHCYYLRACLSEH